MHAPLPDWRNRRHSRPLDSQRVRAWRATERIGCTHRAEEQLSQQSSRAVHCRAAAPTTRAPSDSCLLELAEPRGKGDHTPPHCRQQLQYWQAVAGDTSMTRPRVHNSYERAACEAQLHAVLHPVRLLVRQHVRVVGLKAAEPGGEDQTSADGPAERGAKLPQVGPRRLAVACGARRGRGGRRAGGRAAEGGKQEVGRGALKRGAWGGCMGVLQRPGSITTSAFKKRAR